MTDEHTEETIEDDTADRLADAETKLMLQEAELNRLRPLQLEANIRAIGYDPESTSGRVLAELASKDQTLARDVRLLEDKAKELGLGEDAPAPKRDVADPRFPASHARNRDDDVASKIARREQSLTEKNRQLATAMRGVTPDSGTDDIALRESGFAGEA